MTVDESLALLTPEALKHLKELTAEEIRIDVSRKKNNDIIMQALIRALHDDVIHKTSLNETIVNMLNSSTNTIAASKLCMILREVHQHQPDIKMRFVIAKDTEQIAIFDFDESVGTLHLLLSWVIDYFEITPQVVHDRLSKHLKMTVVSNVQTFVQKYINASTKEEKLSMNVSALTITRLVNMMNHVIYAEFYK